MIIDDDKVLEGFVMQFVSIDDLFYETEAIDGKVSRMKKTMIRNIKKSLSIDIEEIDASVPFSKQGIKFPKIKEVIISNIEEDILDADNEDFRGIFTQPDENLTIDNLLGLGLKYANK